MISASDHENAVLLINEAIASGASCKKACWTVWIVNFNTSHVTVYQSKQKQKKQIVFHFNTSHVTVYLTAAPVIVCSTAISIHLMLRFIPERKRLRDEILKFQYISCYGLSSSLTLICDTS